MLQALRNLASRRAPKNAISAGSFATQKLHKDYDPKKEDQTFELRDGRTIGFAEYGDFKGVPVFYIHGSPASRYDGWYFSKVAKKLNMRMICPDRPGQGLSSIHHNRKLSDYPQDISQLAKHLGIPKYHVIGHSGGGPYAIACAYVSPKNEVLTASVLAGLGPPATLTVKDDGWHTATVMFLANWAPSILRSLLRLAFLDEKWAGKAMKQIEDTYMTEEDKKMIINPENDAVAMASIKQAYIQGPDGPVHDLQVCGRPWDFELKDVKMEVKLFWGLKDVNALPSHGRYYRKHLPNAELFEFEHMTHFNFEKYEDEIFGRILGTWELGTGEAVRR